MPYSGTNHEIRLRTTEAERRLTTLLDGSVLAAPAGVGGAENPPRLGATTTLLGTLDVLGLLKLIDREAITIEPLIDGC